MSTIVSAYRIDALLVGTVAPLGDDGARSAIVKTPVSRETMLFRAGFEGDEQADRSFHGGPEKAVHHYARDHYESWQAEIGDVAALRRAGGFGENISIAGLTEDDVAVGDVFRLGGAIVEVSQARQPCWKLNRRFGIVDMALRVQNTGRSGWYYRVLEPGVVPPDAALELVERRAPEWTLRRLIEALYGAVARPDEWAAMARLAPLTLGWRALAKARLDTGRVEDWSRRLFGNEPTAPAQRPVARGT